MMEIVSKWFATTVTRMTTMETRCLLSSLSSKLDLEAVGGEAVELADPSDHKTWDAGFKSPLPKLQIPLFLVPSISNPIDGPNHTVPYPLRKTDASVDISGRAHH